MSTSDKWVKDRAKTIECERHEYKLWCSGQHINQNIVAVIMDE